MISSSIIFLPLFLGGIGIQELLIIAFVVLLFFGAKKIPELMKGLGKGVRSFKEGMKEIDPANEADEKAEATDKSAEEKKA